MCLNDIDLAMPAPSVLGGERCSSDRPSYNLSSVH